MNRYWIVFYEAKYSGNVSINDDYLVITPFQEFLNKHIVKENIFYLLDRINLVRVDIVNFKEVTHKEYTEWSNI